MVTLKAGSAVLSSRVAEIFQEYIAKPKRTGEERKDPGFRWFDEPNLTDIDRAHMKNWQPIVEALEGDHQ